MSTSDLYAPIVCLDNTGTFNKSLALKSTIGTVYWPSNLQCLGCNTDRSVSFQSNIAATINQNGAATSPQNSSIPFHNDQGNGALA